MKLAPTVNVVAQDSQYYQAFIAAICEGPVTRAEHLYIDKCSFSVPGVNNWDCGFGLWLYSGPDDESQSFPVNITVDANGYQHTACVGNAAGAWLCTGTQTELPSLAIELQAVRFPTDSGFACWDSNPADIIVDILTHTRRGLGLSASIIDTSIDGTGTSTFRTYCNAGNMRLSLVIDTQRTALQVLTDILLATNSDAIWSNGMLKIIPLQDTEITSPKWGSTHFIPNTTAAYDLTLDDFLDRETPVKVTRRADVDCFNKFPVEFMFGNTANYTYYKMTVSDPQEDDVLLRGVREASVMSLPVIAHGDGVYGMMALSATLAKRSLNVRNEYDFTLPWKYALLEPLDIVTITDPSLGISKVRVRILSVEESDDGIAVTAEDCPVGVSSSVQHSTTVGAGYLPQEVTSTMNMTMDRTLDGSTWKKVTAVDSSNKVVANSIATGAVTETKIGAEAVTSAKVGANAIASVHMVGKDTRSAINLNPNLLHYTRG
jgi:hypothetical protein